DVEEAVQRNVEHGMPLVGRHPGEHRIGVNAGVVDQNLDRSGFEQPFEGHGGGGPFGDIEGDRFATAAGGYDRGDYRLSLGQAAIGVDDDMVAVGGQAPADRGADAAAAAGDQGAFHERGSLRASASSTTAARPSSRQRPAWLSENW